MSCNFCGEVNKLTEIILENGHKIVVCAVHLAELIKKIPDAADLTEDKIDSLFSTK